MASQDTSHATETTETSLTPAQIAERTADPVADNPDPVIVADAPSIVPGQDDGADDDAPKAPPPNPRAARMAAIADRLKAERRGENAPEFTGDMADPAQTAGVFGRPQDAEGEGQGQGEGEDAAPAPGAEKRKFKLKVRQQEIELDEDAVLSAAQKALAADSYFEEGKQFLEKAKEVYGESRRGSTPRPHQDDSHRATDDDEPLPEPDPSARPHQGDDAFETLIEEIQLGDKSEAAAKLRTAITQAVSEGADSALIGQKMRDDFSETMLTFEKFKSENAALANDKAANAVMKELIFDGYRDDLRAIGVPEDRIPKADTELADWHRFYRVKGHKVRTTEKLLTDVKTAYVSWRGAAPGQQANPSPAPRPGQPRVAIDRSERRQAIPTQPTRASAPPQRAPTAIPQRRAREAVMADMRKARGK